MVEAIDQIFVIAKHWVVGQFPAAWQSFVSVLLSIVPILMVFPLLFAVTTIVERKALGRIQNRFGPNRVGPWGLLQPVADGLKMLTKEDIIPRPADRIVHFLAPVALIVPSLLALSVIPYGRNMVPIDLDAGLLFFFAVGAGTELAVFMAGWSSRNKYSLLGAMRAIAQMVSYEIPLILAAVSVVMLVGSLSTVGIVEAQGERYGWLLKWHLFTPWGLAGFVLFMIAAAAESNRAPFDIPEGESEIIAGYLVDTPDSSLPCSFWESISVCSRSAGWRSHCFSADGTHRSRFWNGYLRTFGSLENFPRWFFFSFGCAGRCLGCGSIN